jgi:hypothetical protein
MQFLTKGKTNWKYILIVVILAAIVGGWIFGYLRYFNKEISSLTKFPEIKKPEKPKIEEEIANWKTYRNEEYGFEIKYPEDLKIYTDSLPTVVEFGKNEWRIFGIKFYRNVCELPENVKCVSFKDWISKAFSPTLWKKETKNIFGIGDYTEIEIIEPFIFGEEKLQGILVKNYITVGAADVIFPLVFIQRNGAIYEIYMEPPPTSFRIPYELNLEPKYDYKGYDKIFNQMLSTFRFLE